MIVKDQVQRILIVAPSCQPQVWYQTILRMSSEKYVPTPHHTHLLLNQKKTIIEVVCTVSRSRCLVKEFHSGPPSMFK